MAKNPLSVTDASHIHGMTRTEGWKILSRELRERFDNRYTKLRKSNRDSTFYKIQGYLDAIDEVFNIVEQKMSDIQEGEE